MICETALNLISLEMRGLIGTVQRRHASYPICASDIRRWAIAVYYPDPAPPQYLRTGTAAGEAPLTAPEEFNPFAWSRPGQAPGRTDGGPGELERRAGITPPAVSFIVNGGAVCEYGAPMQEGDTITAELRVRSYVQKQGRRGPLLITETEDRWTNQHGEAVRNTIHTSIRY